MARIRVVKITRAKVGSKKKNSKVKKVAKRKK